MALFTHILKEDKFSKLFNNRILHFLPILIISNLCLVSSVPHGAPCFVFPPTCDQPLLECVSNVCQCKGENTTTIWDDAAQSCFSLEGTAGCTINPSNPSTPPTDFLCIPTATCYYVNGIARCVCQHQLQSNADKMCYLFEGQRCSIKNDLCDPLQFLHCNQEYRCSCDGDATYDPDTRKCVKLPGANCTTPAPPAPECIQNTTCLEDLNEAPNMRCFCPDFSKPSKDDPAKCYIPYDESCDADDPICDPFQYLVCTNAKCACDGQGVSSIWDEESNTCYRLAGELCGSSSSDMKCIPTATCKNSTGVETCRCIFPLAAGEDQMCYLHHKQRCTMDNDLCNPLQFLHCDQENRCSCDAGATYDGTQNSCVLLPGSECTSSPAIPTPGCINNTDCTYDPNDMTKMQCLCSKSSEPSKEDPTKCYIRYEEPCDADGPICDPFQHLVCSNGNCACDGEDEESIWDKESGTCYRLANKDCFPFLSEMKCIPTAKCSANLGVHSCRCISPLAPGDDKMCYLHNGQKCTVDNDLCNPLQFLYCDQENQCSCIPGAFFDTGLNMCVLLPDSECSFGADKIQCIKDTYCDPETLKCTCPGTSKPSKDDPTKCFFPHGQPCEIQNFPDTLCDPHSKLECRVGTCVCQDEAISSIYDKKSDTCYRLANEECGTSSSNMSCIPTANCKSSDGSSLCKCKFPLSIGSDRMCYLKHRQNCTTDNDFCDKNLFLLCNQEGFCACSKDAIYSEAAGTCLLLPDAHCLFPVTLGSQLCVPTTECKLDAVLPIENATSRCICPGISVRSKIDHTLCVLSHSDPCSPTGNKDLCDPYAFLICSDTGHCVCGDQSRTYFDPETNTCFLKANEICTSAPLLQQCTPNSKCLAVGGETKCVCDRGFVKNRNGRCYLPHQSRCDLANDLCDPAAFLTCDLENHCSCSEDAIFNRDRNNCHLRANATCIQEINPEFPNQPCVENARCTNSKRCECIGDLASNVDRLCFLQHGQVCDPGRDLCDTKNNLQCNDRTHKCTCLGQEEGWGWFNAFSRKCYILAGGECDDGVINSPPVSTELLPHISKLHGDCIPNSYCDPLDHICTCNGTLEPNQNRFCYLPYDAGCNNRNDLCDPEAFLECKMHTGKCACKREYETYYDFQSKTCRLIHDRPCSTDEGSQLCDPNAECWSTAPGNSTLRCRCIQHFQPNMEKICYSLYDQSCDKFENECDPYGHLNCREDLGKVCRCKTDRMYFNTDLQQCLIFPGESCRRAQEAQKCRENAYCNSLDLCECLNSFETTIDNQCLMKYGGICYRDLCNTQVNLDCRNGVCLCEQGFFEHSTRHLSFANELRTVCLPGYNITCNEILGLEGLSCSPDAFLTCRNGLCTCNFPEDQIFIGSERQCRSTVGMKCNDVSELCVPLADCILNEQLEPKYGVCTCDVNSTISKLDKRFCISGARSLVMSLLYVAAILIVLVSIFSL